MDTTTLFDGDSWTKTITVAVIELTITATISHANRSAIFVVIFIKIIAVSPVALSIEGAIETHHIAVCSDLICLQRIFQAQTRYAAYSTECHFFK